MNFERNKNIPAKKSILILYPGMFYSPWGRLIRIKPHLVYLYSVLNQFFNVEILDLEIEFGRPLIKEDVIVFQKKSVSLILEHNFDIFAISCYTSANYLASIYFAQKIKELSPDKLIIVGGYHPSQIPSDFMYKNSPFDHIVCGEVENWIEYMMNATSLNDKITDGPILINTNKTYSIKKPIVPTNIPYYNQQKDIKSIGLFLSKGCPYTCNFCLEFKKKWDVLSVSSAIDAINEIREKINPSVIFFYDACFGFQNEWKQTFFIELVNMQSQNYYWLETRPTLIDEDDIDLLSKVNIIMNFGVDSFSEDMLMIMNKTSNPIKYLNQFLLLNKYMNRLKMRHKVFLILNHPGESLQTLTQSCNFIQEHLSELCNGFLNIGYQFYSFFPGSEVYNNIDYYTKKYGTLMLYLYNEWWKIEKDPYINSLQIIPSKEYFDKRFNKMQQELIELIHHVNSTNQYDSNEFMQKYCD